MIVVAAGILEKDGRIMLCQRKPNGHNALKWEFAGGKLEPGETGERALERELREELGIETRTGVLFDAIEVCEDGRSLRVQFYFTELISGQPQPLDCNAVVWVDPKTLLSYDLAPTDAVVAAKLAGDISDGKLYL